MPRTPTLLAPLVTVVPLQVFACELAHGQGPRRRPAAQPRQVRHRRVSADRPDVGGPARDRRRRDRRGRRRPVRRVPAAYPALLDRLFTDDERDLPLAQPGRAVRGQGGAGQGPRCAGRAALARRVGVHGRRRPAALRTTGTVAARAAELGVQHLHVSLSHDAGIATAVVDRRGRSVSRCARPTPSRPCPAADDGALPTARLPGRRAHAAGRRRARRGGRPAARGGAGGVYGRRVVLLVGPGNNGGDALWAGARLAAGERGSTRCSTDEQVHEPGLAALSGAGGRRSPSRRRRGARAARGRPTSWSTGSLGIGGRAGLRGAAATAGRGCGSLPRDVAGRRRRPAQRRRPRHRRDARAARARRRHRDLRGAQAVPAAAAGPARRRRASSSSTSAWCRTWTGRRSSADRHERSLAARCWPVPGPDDDKYRRGVVGVVAGGAALHRGGRARRRRRAARGRRHGALRRSGRAARLVRARWPEVVAGDGRVQAWVLGSGVDPDADDGQREAVARGRSPRTCRASSTPARSRCCRAAGDAPTPADPARRRARPPAQRRRDAVERADVEAAPAAPRPPSRSSSPAPPCCSRARPRCLPATGGRVRTQADGPPGSPRPAPATCWPACSGRCSPPGCRSTSPPRSASPSTAWPARSPARPGCPPAPRRGRRAARSAPAPCWTRCRKPSPSCSPDRCRQGRGRRPSGGCRVARRLAGRPAGVGARGRRLREWHA